MTAAWSVTWQPTVTVVLVLMVAVGTLPVLGGLYQYLLLPWHGLRNHLSATAPYLPRVAVLVPAWNEGSVLETSLERLMRLEYPPDRLRVLVIDDASTDDTPQVVGALATAHPGRIVHVRREVGGQGKAHTLNAGIRVALDDAWMEAALIMDADVVFRPDALRRLTRHLADPAVGAATGYIKEGSRRPDSVARFIGYEYVTAQAAARRAQNVYGALACLAGGAQLHSRANLISLGGRIDTTTLAEDTYTTFLTQLGGRRAVFDPTAVVLAEEPASIGALWKQRLRWARGNVEITRRFRRVWFRPSRLHRLGSLSFGVTWFAVLLLPVALIVSTVGLLGLWRLDAESAARAFSAYWWLGGGTYLFVTLTTLLIDPATARRTVLQAITYPGLGAIAVMLAAWFPHLWSEDVPSLVGLRVTDTGRQLLIAMLYAWGLIAMLLAPALVTIERLPGGRRVAVLLLYVVGYGPLQAAITLDAYVKEWRGAPTTWDKTVKTGKVLG